MLVLQFFSTFQILGHHFKGLPHYNYFENYPQVPEEEFLGQVGEYELSLVVYDFQGIDRVNVADPDKVRLFLVIFNLRENRVYGGRLHFEILDREAVLFSHRFEKAELENLYSLHRDLPSDGQYSIRVTLEDEDFLVGEIPFYLSSQRTHWGHLIAASLIILVTITAIGARRKRIQMDRRGNRQAAKKEHHAAC
jgi:hypothetical protein